MIIIQKNILATIAEYQCSNPLILNLVRRILSRPYLALKVLYNAHQILSFSKRQLNQPARLILRSRIGLLISLILIHIPNASSILNCLTKACVKTIYLSSNQQNSDSSHLSTIIANFNVLHRTIHLFFIYSQALFYHKLYAIFVPIDH